MLRADLLGKDVGWLCRVSLSLSSGGGKEFHGVQYFAWGLPGIVRQRENESWIFAAEQCSSFGAGSSDLPGIKMWVFFILLGVVSSLYELLCNSFACSPFLQHNQ